MLPFALYVITEEVGGSGVIAIVIAAGELNSRAAVDEVGSQLWHAVWIGTVLSGVCIAVRFIWLFLAFRANRRRVEHHEAPGLRAPLRPQEVLGRNAWPGHAGTGALHPE